MMKSTGAIALSAVLYGADALDNGLALTPPMGWRSWNCDHLEVTDAKIRKTIDAITDKTRMVDGVPTSLADIGYGRVGVDDGWQACNTGVMDNRTHKASFHAEDGTPLVNKTIFPSLADLVKYGHSKDVKMGWYLNNCYCMDEYTLQEDPSWAQKAYKADIKMVVDANFDGVKIDNCGDDQGIGYIARTDAANATGHALLTENSNQGHMGNPRGNPTNNTYCPFNFFRSGGDIGPDFGGVIAKLQRTIPYLGNESFPPISRPSCWAYPDMLEVGNFGTGQERCDTASAGVGAKPASWYASAPGQLAVIESRTHFGAWCIVSSPLILGLDITDSARVDSIWDIVTNREAIAVNQAWAGQPGRLVESTNHYQLWSKIIKTDSDGHVVTVAALIFNQGDQTLAAKDVKISALGLSAKVSKSRDVWNHKDDGAAVVNGAWKVGALTTHDSAFYVFSV
jgi:alpha-galactosidase